MGVLLFLFLVIFYFNYFFSLSFGFPFDPEKIDYQKAVNIPLLGWIDSINLGRVTSQYLAPKFKSEKWPQKQILDDITKAANNRYVIVSVLVDKMNLNAENLEIERELGKYTNIELNAPYITSPFVNDKDIEGYLSNFKYVLIPENSFGPENALRHLDTLKQLKEFILGNSDKLRKVQVYNLPDGDNLILYEINF